MRINGSFLDKDSEFLRRKREANGSVTRLFNEATPGEHVLMVRA
jgi:hypothetical protein